MKNFHVLSSRLKNIFPSFGSDVSMYQIHRTHVSPVSDTSDLGSENFEMDGYRWFKPAWKNVLQGPRWWERLGLFIPQTFPPSRPPGDKRGMKFFHVLSSRLKKYFPIFWERCIRYIGPIWTHVSDTWVRIWDQKFLRWMDTDGSNQPGKM